MADISDVCDALAQLVGTTLYPSGGSGNSVAGLPVLVQQGWPDSASLQKDFLTKGKAQVTIYPRPGERNTTRSEARWEEVPAPAATYALTVTGQSVAVSGSAPSTYFAQNLAIAINGTPYVTQAQAGASAASLATALGALIAADWSQVNVSGSVITLPALARIDYARVGSTGQASKEVRRQARQIQITVWAPTPDFRTAIVRAVDPVLADTPRLPLSDGTTANLTYFGSPMTDADQKQGIYRRDLIYTADFPTIRTLVAPQLIVPEMEVLDPFGTAIFGNLDFTDPANALFAALV